MQIAEIQKALQQAGIDGWLFYDHHLRDPLGYRVLGFAPPRTPSRRWYYLIPAHGEPRGLVHVIEPGMLDALPGAKAQYSGWHALHQGLSTLLKGVRRVAMQYSPHCAILTISMVDAGTVEQVRSIGPEVVSSADLLQLFEARWTPEQLAQHQSAGGKVDAIRRAAFAAIGPESTELSIQRFILEAFDREGLFTDHGPIVAVNANASNPHYEPTPESHQPVRPGDVVLIDLWAKLKQPGAVYYDITWTGFYGAAIPERVQRVFEVVRDARKKASAFARAGVAGFEVDDVVRGHIREQGFGEYFVHRTGHSIGEDVHGAGANMDNLETHDTRRLIPGLCFSIEPGVYLPEFGIRSEVNVYIQGDGSSLVTGEQQEELVRIG
jgi:Xaa-Pro aminopeptidase